VSYGPLRLERRIADFEARTCRERRRKADSVDIKHLITVAVAAIGAVSAAVELVVKLATNMSLLQKIVGQYRDKILVGILCLTCLAAGALLGEWESSSRSKLDIQKLQASNQDLRRWAEQGESDKKFLFQALNQAPVWQREYDRRCQRQEVPCVFLYSDSQYGGRWLALPVGEYPDMRMLAFNDTARSIKIRGKVHVLAFVDINYQGDALPIDRSTPVLDDEFNQTISSVRVLPN